MNKTAFFGGSFNPIHNGHLALLKAVMEHTGCTHGLISPAAESPFKRGGHQAGEKDRLEMVRAAVKNQPDISVCDIELYMKKPSYTYNTLLAVKAQRPQSEIYLVCGSDAFLSFEKWFRYRDIFRLAVICTAVRTPGEEKAVAEQAEKLKKEGARIEICPFEPVGISSSGLREKIAGSQDISQYVPSGVAEYIKEHGLYKTGEE